MEELLSLSPGQVSEKWRQFRATAKPVRLGHVAECLVDVCNSLEKDGDVEVTLGLGMIGDSKQVLIGRYRGETDDSLRLPISVRLNGVARLDHLEVDKNGLDVSAFRFGRNMRIIKVSPRYDKLPLIIDSVINALDHTLELNPPKIIYVHPMS